jgi:hypothetical protein
MAHDAAELEARLAKAADLLVHLQHLVTVLDQLVPKAFEEGFRRRHPEQEEPWLVDWLGSATRAELHRILPRGRASEGRVAAARGRAANPPLEGT